MPKIYSLFINSLAIAIFAYSTLFAAAPSDNMIIKDSLDTLISDFEKSETAKNPIKSGQLGNIAALRMLPNVSFKAKKNNEALIESFIQRHLALSSKQMDENTKLN